MFNLDPPQSIPEIRRSGRKRKFTDPLMIDPKRIKILTALLRSKSLGGGVLWEPYPSHHNGLFSPLLVLRDFAVRGSRSISVLSEQYETSYLFYVTLSFLCNIICYLISVFAFSLVTLSGATTVIINKIQLSTLFDSNRTESYISETVASELKLEIHRSNKSIILAPKTLNRTSRR